MGVDVDVPTQMEASIEDVGEILEAMEEVEDAGAQVMWRYTMTMGISLLIP